MKIRCPKWYDGFSFGAQRFLSFGRLSFTFKKKYFNKDMFHINLCKIYRVANI